MSDRHFIDTNVFVYSVNRNDPEKQRTANALLREAMHSANGSVSYQVVQEFFSVAFRRFAGAMTVADAEDYLAAVFRQFQVVHSSTALFIEALGIYREHKLSWYDALIVAAAQQARCTVLYTEDMQHGRQFGALRVVNPFL